MGAFLDGTFDEVRVVYAQFVSDHDAAAGRRAAAADRARGRGRGRDGAGRARARAAPKAEQDYIWEPSQEELFAVLLPLYLRNRVFMTLSEAFTSEHAARMT